MKKKCTSFKAFTLALFLGILLCPFVTKAAPAYPGVVKFSQPSGEEFKGRIKGDEFFHWTETEQGDVLARDEKGYWNYATILNGKIASTGRRYKLDFRPYNTITNKDVKKVAPQKLSKNPMYVQKKKSTIKKVTNRDVQGTEKILTILVDFKNVKVITPETTWASTFFGNGKKSVADYYKEVSKGKFYFVPAEENGTTKDDGIVKVSLTSNHPNIDGEANETQTDEWKAQQIITLVTNTLKASDAYVDYSKFDTNGDGVISRNELHICIITAGNEASSGATTNAIWAHSWGLPNGVTLDGKTVCKSDDTENDGGYTMQGEMQLGDYSNYPATIGVFCHELGHSLGLPDLYDTTEASEGLGVHSLMAAGSWTQGDEQYPGASPVHLDAWSKVFLGFVKPSEVSASGNFTVDNFIKGNQTILKVTTQNPKEYFLIENREFNGFDKGLKDLCDFGGIAIYHVDDKVIDDNFYNNSVNDNAAHKGVDIEEAMNDGQLDTLVDYEKLTSGFNHYFSKDSNTTFGPTTKPNSNLYDGSKTNITVTASEASSDSMKVQITTNAPSDITAPTVKSTSPINLENNVAINSTIKVQFDELIDGDVNLNNISLKDSKGNAVSLNISVSGDTITITPKTALSYGENYYVTIPAKAVKDKSGNSLGAEYKFSFFTSIAVDNTQPTVKVADPVNNSKNVDKDKTIQITFSEAIKSGVDFSKIALVDSKSNKVNANVTVSGDKLTVTPSASLAYSTSYTLTVPKGAITDLAGNTLTADYSLTFTIMDEPDTTQPTVKVADPVNSSKNVDKNKTIQITFSEAIKSGVDFSKIALVDSKSNKVNTNVTVSGDKLTVTPSASLAYSTSYTLTVPKGAITDLAGNTLASDYSLTFTIMDEPDTTPPAVKAVNPLNGAVDVSLNTEVTVTFSENIVSGSNYSNIALKDDKGNSVSIDKSISGSVLKITLNKNLSYSTNYELEVPAGAVKDGASNLNAAYSSSFKTVKDTTPVVITDNGLGGNTSNVSKNNKQFTLSFNKGIVQGDKFNDISLIDWRGKEIECTIKIDTISNQLIVESKSELAYGAKYSIFIPKGAIKDKDGNELTKDESISFATEAEPKNEITRLEGKDRYETAIQISKEGWNKSDYVVIARGSDFPDALSAAPLAKLYNAPILLSDTNTFLPSLQAELKRLSPKKVFIVGGTGVVSYNVEKGIRSLTSNGIVVERIYGKDRYETALAVAEKMGGSKELVIATGKNYPDALSIASFAASNSIPIMLTDNTSLYKGALDYIKKYGVNKVYILGGTGVISDKIEQTIKNQGCAVERFGGKDRYETNYLVLKKLASRFDFTDVYFATGKNFPDALAGTALASLTKSPIVLVGDGVNSNTIAHLREQMNNIKVKHSLGGEGVLSSVHIKNIFKN